jgi:hypothetical protein
MGKVASDKCHKWVFKEPTECEPNISNYWQSSFDAVCLKAHTSFFFFFNCLFLFLFLFLSTYKFVTHIFYIHLKYQIPSTISYILVFLLVRWYHVND